MILKKQKTKTDLKEKKAKKRSGEERNGKRKFLSECERAVCSYHKSKDSVSWRIGDGTRGTMLTGGETQPRTMQHEPLFCLLSARHLKHIRLCC